MSYPQMYEVKTTDPKLPKPGTPDPTAPRNPAPRVMEGAAIVASDGEKVGTVAETRDQHFRVAKPGIDYWLSNDRVVASSKERVELDIGSDEAVAYGFDHPPVGDNLLSHREREEQREHMEEELEEQREERETGA